MDALVKQDEAGAQEIKRAAGAVDELLDVRQRARFRVFEHQLEIKKLELLARVRQQIPAPTAPADSRTIAEVAAAARRAAEEMEETDVT